MLLSCFCFLWLTLTYTFAQVQTKQVRTSQISTSVYFASDKFDLNADAQMRLQLLYDSIKTLKKYRIVINGNTDNVGDSLYNLNLSKNRCEAVKQYLLTKGVNLSNFSEQALGESKPIAENESDKGKQKNRRVDIRVINLDNSKAIAKKSIVTPIPKPLPKPEIPPIAELYAKLQTPLQQFTINALRDTMIIGKQGTILKISAASFRKTNCPNNALTVELREDYNKSSMLLDNLSTASNGQPIVTQGMIYTRVKDCNGKVLEPIMQNGVTALMPTDSINPNMQLFTGGNNEHQRFVNWMAQQNAPTQSNLALLESVNFKNYRDCLGELDVLECKKVPFFFGRVKRVFKPIQGTFNSSIRAQNKAFRTCQKQLRRNKSIAKKGSINNGGQTKIAGGISINTTPAVLRNNLSCADLKRLMQKYGVKTPKKLYEVLLKESVKSGAMDNSLLYNIFSIKKMGWANCDAFYAIPENAKCTIRLNQVIAPNVDCKLVFTRMNMIFPYMGVNGDTYNFIGIPKNEPIKVFALKYENGKAFLAIQAVTDPTAEVELNYKEVTVEQMMEELKQFDKH